MIKADQIPATYKEEIDEQIAIFEERRTFEERKEIPDTKEIPIVDKGRWFRIRSVISVFVDMKGSTQLSASTRESDTAGAYQLFTGTGVALFDKFEAPYIDIKGDGVFALFNSGQEYRALCAAVTFKTFAREEFIPRINAKTGLSLGCHIGIDQKIVLVRKLGLKRYSDRSDRQNEVWAGKPVNMVSKLASLAQDNEVFVSDRFYEKITDQRARLSCGCSGGQPGNQKAPLWTEFDLSNDTRFDFDKAYVLKSPWCERHGKEYCEALLRLDDD
jgi:class 3 adenylate cyclase